MMAIIPSFQRSGSSSRKYVLRHYRGWYGLRRDPHHFV